MLNAFLGVLVAQLIEDFHLRSEAPGTFSGLIPPLYLIDMHGRLLFIQHNSLIFPTRYVIGSSVALSAPVNSSEQSCFTDCAFRTPWVSLSINLICPFRTQYSLIYPDSLLLYHLPAPAPFRTDIRYVSSL